MAADRAVVAFLARALQQVVVLEVPAGGRQVRVALVGGLLVTVIEEELLQLRCSLRRESGVRRAVKLAAQD